MEWVRGKIIGRGSFGTVSLATLNSNTTSIVVKSSSISYSKSLENEKEALVELGNHHPNIIQFFGDSLSEEKGVELYNLFFEYASRGSLADQLRSSGGQFEVSEVKRYTKEILKGLCYIHEKGYVHSDVKLQNILLLEDGTLKIADFGLARRVDDVDDSRCRLTGTPLYMSPEIVAGGKRDTAADVWALGCAVVEMVSGKPAWECSPESDVNGLLYRIGVRGELPKIPGNLCDDEKDFLGKCFVKDPNERWTARMLLEHPFVCGLDEFDRGQMPSVSPRCPFEFPDWESMEDSSFVSGSVKSSNSFGFSERFEYSFLSSFSERFEGQLVSDRVPDWTNSDGWVTIR